MPLKNLTIKQLRLVAALGSELSVSRAADGLHMTQPAASRSLAQLESLLGVQLFHRQANRIFPTAAGIRFIHHAQRVLDQLQLAEHDLAGNLPLVRELRVGAIASFSSALLAEAVRRSNESLGEVRIRISSGNIGYLYGQLLAGDIDLMMSHAELGVDLSRVQVLPLYEEYTSVVCSHGHPLCGSRHPSWDQIASQPWILPPAFTPSRSKLDRIVAVFRSEEPGRLPDVEVESAAVAVQLLANHRYLAILAHREALAWQLTGHVALLPTPEVILRGHMCCLALRDSATKALATAFTQTLTRLATVLPSDEAKP